MPTPSTDVPGLILLVQPVLQPISPAEIRAALPPGWHTLPRCEVEFDLDVLAQPAPASQDFVAAARALDEQYHARVEPLRQKHPEYHVVYFGTAPIPLAMYLGFLVGTWHPAVAMLHDHERRTWEWRAPNPRPPAHLAPPMLPAERDRSPGEAVIRVSTSHLVDPLLTRQLVPDALVELDIRLEQPAEDAFTSGEEITRVADAFKQALDEIADRFPGVGQVHVFASVQPGVAFLLGTRVSATMHPAVQTYQYERAAEGSHVPALRLVGPSASSPRPLSSQEVARAAADRAALAEDLEKMKALAEPAGQRPDAPWSAILDPETHDAIFPGTWRHLPAARGTPLAHTAIDTAARAVPDSFRLDPRAMTWQLDDGWLARVAARLGDPGLRRRALRMLVWHEAVHRGLQGLSSATSRGMGRFPKVLEEIDYQADVWSLVHEYRFTRWDNPKVASEPGRFFREAIRVATATMWAFDDGAEPLREIQIRRLNRYLIWYWQYLLLERGGSSLDLSAVLALLAERPLIELAGPRLLSHGERIWFVLDPRRLGHPELAVYFHGRLFRYGSRIDLSIEALVDGVRHRNEERIIDVLRSAVEHTAR